MSFPRGVAEIATERMVLQPLRVDHADEMVAVLADPVLYFYTGGTPPSLADLQRRYTAQVAGSGDQAEIWLNWIARLTSTGEAVGFVQATVETTHTSTANSVGPQRDDLLRVSDAVRELIRPRTHGTSGWRPFA